MGEYLDVDAGLVRLAWVVLACVTLGMAAIFYAVLCAIMPSKVIGVAAPSDLPGAPADNAVTEELSRAVAKDLSQEARLLIEVRRELGPDYEEELVESFVDKVEEGALYFHVAMTHFVDDCPAYDREKLPEMGKAMAGTAARAEELNVKTLFVVNAAPEHVAYGLFEAGDAYSLALLLTDLPLRQDFKVSAVDYQQNIMKRAMEEAAARG